MLPLTNTNAAPLILAYETPIYTGRKMQINMFNREAVGELPTTTTTMVDS